MMEETLQVTTEHFKRCALIKGVGRVDSYTAPKLEESMNALTDKNVYKIVFDMAGINFVSSKGWWVLIETQKRCKRYNRGELVLVNIDDKISSALELIGLTDYFKIFDDITNAVGSF